MDDRMCYRKFRYGCVLAAVWIAFVPATKPAGAETAASRYARAEEYIREALHYELDGATAERQRLLASSLELAPEYPPARWQNGYVKYFNHWVEADSITQIAKFQKRLTLYESQRDRTPQNAPGWLALANWCAKNDFPLQERAHLSQVLEQFPDHPEARHRLGFKRVGGMWVESDALWQGMQQSATRQTDLRTWTPRLSILAKKLRSGDEAKRAEAEEELLSLTDVSAIPALERMAGSDSQYAKIVIRVLGRMPYPEASAALARLGVFLPWLNARCQAALELRQHPADNYIPGLLAEMATPITSRIQSLQDNGRLFYRQVFVREVQNQTQTAVLDTLFQPDFIVLGEGDVADVDFGAGFNDLLGKVFEVQAGREQQRLAQNQLIALMNRRICQVLQYATGKLLDEDPQVWWAWWDQYNQVLRLGAKRDNRQFQQEMRSYYIPVYASQAQASTENSIDKGRVGQSKPQRPLTPRRRMISRADGKRFYVQPCSCFVAGTSVQTARGRMNIESIVPGDLVLSQDVNSGELSYKPVLQTTLRPPAPVVAVQMADAQLEATTGHPFWVNGTGWTFAHELTSGMVLHGADGAVPISDVLTSSDQPAYNLVVADFHTYFVGERKVLVHDNTSRQPTNAQVPGLAKSMD